MVIFYKGNADFSRGFAIPWKARSHLRNIFRLLQRWSLYGCCKRRYMWKTTNPQRTLHFRFFFIRWEFAIFSAWVRDVPHEFLLLFERLVQFSIMNVQRDTKQAVSTFLIKLVPVLIC